MQLSYLRLCDVMIVKTKSESNFELTALN
jgi:hypothetical protein